MDGALDDCECGHVALDHYYDPGRNCSGKCSKCDCKKFKKKVDPNLGPYDHVPT